MPCLWADSKTLFSTSDENDIIGSQTEYKMFCQVQMTTKHKKKIILFFSSYCSRDLVDWSATLSHDPMYRINKL